MSLSKEGISQWLRSLQQDICKQLEAADGVGQFVEDAWKRPGGGGGYSRVIKGQLIEKGGVNYSAVHGPMPEQIAKGLKMESGVFYATGVSIVLHPLNPYAPIIHMNVRYFEMDSGIWWFGGGIDLTPHYVFKEDAKVFHQKLKAVCDRHDSAYYPKYKEWADNYFFLKHRDETRGVGGIFFDRLGAEKDKTKESCFNFLKDVGQAFCDIYIPLLKKAEDFDYGEKEQQWQKLRRGRYVEFNLVWDRGTKFGLDTNGRTESILMSLPPLASWEYAHVPEPGSQEAETQDFLKKGIDWVNYT